MWLALRLYKRKIRVVWYEWLISDALTTMLILVMVTATAGASAACNRAPAYTPPTATIILEAAPLEMDAMALYEEWMGNPDATMARYNGMKLYFKGVVEQVNLLRESPDSDLFAQIGPVKFRVAVPGDIKNVQVGNTIDAVGKLWGMQDGNLIISDCWVRVNSSGKPGRY
jgi:hypothetical protein